MGAVAIPEQREAVWLALASVFLDSDERPWLPRQAAVLLRAGLSIDEARWVFVHEVAPAVHDNLGSVAGVWGAWDPDWLARTVRASALEPGRDRLAVMRLEALLAALHPAAWRGIAAAMEALSEVEGEGRAQRADDLVWLGSRFFDFSAAPVSSTERLRLWSVYEQCFERAFGPVIHAAERAAGHARVRDELVR